MLFVGIDLTSAFSQQPRAIDIALLDDHLNCRFVRAIWPQTASVTNRDTVVLRRMLSVPIGNEPKQVWAIDGPQGLASAGQTMRHCERVLGTPGHTPDMLPPLAPGSRPFGDYIRSSVDLFAALLSGQPALQLAGLGASNRDERHPLRDLSRQRMGRVGGPKTPTQDLRCWACCPSVFAISARSPGTADEPHGG